MKQSKPKTIDELTDEFLKTNDPFYRERRRNKGRRIEFPYLTKQQLDEVKNREIPFSSLGRKQLEQCAAKNCDVNSYIEAGELNG